MLVSPYPPSPSARSASRAVSAWPAMSTAGNCSTMSTLAVFGLRAGRSSSARGWSSASTTSRVRRVGSRRGIASACRGCISRRTDASTRSLCLHCLARDLLLPVLREYEGAEEVADLRIDARRHARLLSRFARVSMALAVQGVSGTVPIGLQPVPLAVLLDPGALGIEGVRFGMVRAGFARSLEPESLVLRICWRSLGGVRPRADPLGIKRTHTWCLPSCPMAQHVSRRTGVVHPQGDCREPGRSLALTRNRPGLRPRALPLVLPLVGARPRRDRLEADRRTCTSSSPAGS